MKLLFILTSCLIPIAFCDYNMAIFESYGEIPFERKCSIYWQVLYFVLKFYSGCIVEGGLRYGYCMDLSVKEFVFRETNETITNLECRIFSEFRDCVPPYRCCTDGWNYSYKTPW